MHPPRLLLSILPALMLAGCSLQPPNPAPMVQDCANVPVSAPQAEGMQQSFFFSTAIPDCSEGTFKLAEYRHPDRTYGSGQYELIEGDAQPPVLSKHAEEAWLAGVEQALAAPAADRRLLIFIHGYATGFEEAHKDAAEVRALAGDDVPLVVIHWPSRNRASDYLLDGASLRWAQDDITALVGRLTAMSDDITLVSHSMGARALANAVLTLERDPAARPETIRRIALASPDFDRHEALRLNGTIDQLLARERQVLVYASQRDRALQASRTVNGYARLGSTSCEYDVVFDRRALGERGNCHLTEPRQGLFMVDTGPSDAEGIIRHNDFLRSCHVREDLRTFLRDEPPPAYRVAQIDGDLEGFVIDPMMEYPGAPCAPMEMD